jgi:hypothetical protein
MLEMRTTSSIGRVAAQRRRSGELILPPTPGLDGLKRCTKCGEEKPLAEFSRARSRKDGRAAHCKGCVRRWQQENAEHMADYHRRWQQANVGRKREAARRYRERRRVRPPEANDG